MISFYLFPIIEEGHQILDFKEGRVEINPARDFPKGAWPAHNHGQHAVGVDELPVVHQSARDSTTQGVTLPPNSGVIPSTGFEEKCAGSYRNARGRLSGTPPSKPGGPGYPPFLEILLLLSNAPPPPLRKHPFSGMWQPQAPPSVLAHGGRLRKGCVSSSKLALIQSSATLGGLRNEGSYTCASGVTWYSPQHGPRRVCNNGCLQEGEGFLPTCRLRTAPHLKSNRIQPWKAHTSKHNISFWKLW